MKTGSTTTRRGFLRTMGLAAAALAGGALRRASAGDGSPDGKKRPNIVLILCDDLGYECLGCDGGLDCKTPVLDGLAAGGVRFANCHAQPLCTPSRAQIMTGRYNVRNYELFGYLNPAEVTFANRLRDAGYATCIAGKWQLSGDGRTVRDFGFDQHCLWNMHAYHVDATGRKLPDPEGWLKRYADPTLYRNGQWMAEADTKGKYGPDICCDFICSFIEANRGKPFLAYYPMILTHDPFTPTPDSAPRGQAAGGQGKAGAAKRNFTDMVEYTDKLVGRIVACLEKLGLREDTLLLFVGDNGTGRAISSRTAAGEIKGGKGETTDAGTRVPMIASWPGRAAKGKVCDDLVDLTDYLPTICQCAGAAVPAEPTIDGRSFLPQILGAKGDPRVWLYAWFSRDGGSKGAKIWARDKRYKLYSDGNFFDVVKDPFEKSPLADTTLDDEARKARVALQAALDQYANARPAAMRKQAGAKKDAKPNRPAKDQEVG